MKTRFVLSKKKKKKIVGIEMQFKFYCQNN